MTLTDNNAYRQIIGSLMKKPMLLLEYDDIYTTDFIDNKVARICYISIRTLYENGVNKMTPLDVDQEIAKYENSAAVYKSQQGLEFLKDSYHYSDPDNFSFYYNRLKKYSLLNMLRLGNYDISQFYKENCSMREENEIRERFDNATIEDILTNVEAKFNEIKSDFLKNGRASSDPADGIFELLDSLEASPDNGPALIGDIFSMACRGARSGCLYIKSASTSVGKSRTAVFDACHLCYPVHWSYEQGTFVRNIIDGELQEPRKVLFIVTEMSKDELQTIMLAYLSGVNEEHILNHTYTFVERARVWAAAEIIKYYSGYFFIEEISDPNLNNIEAVIKKYATVEQIKYCFYDYVHTTPGLMNQFGKSELREDVVLMLMSNQLKQLAKDYGMFIFSATQVNAAGMENTIDFKDEKCIRGSKAVADKIDLGFVMSKVTDKMWNSVVPILRSYVRENIAPPTILQEKPTHVLDIYKMRRGRYKNVRIWIELDLGTGQRRDLMMTTADNEPISITSIQVDHEEQAIINWEKEGLFN